ncbi:hypothetical protein FKW77_009953 [Venturia effusa]|uniref:Uncharacterized protein n=1 Tax=Venturia effusa TaxID=50376 RepID=A0A517LA31_9PEZI|nr:hypothetical protein FKW77_009953 [Venturia effusa]
MSRQQSSGGWGTHDPAPAVRSEASFGVASDINSSNKSSSSLNPGGTPASSSEPLDASAINPDLPRFSLSDVQKLLDLVLALKDQKNDTIRPDPKNLELPHGDVFTGNNASSFLSRLENRYELFGFTRDEDKCQGLIINCHPHLYDDIEVLEGWREKNWKTFRAAFRGEFAAMDERRKKGRVEYLEACASKSEEGVLGTKVFIREFKKYWPVVVKTRRATAATGQRIFFSGLPEEIGQEVIRTVPIELRRASSRTYEDMDRIIVEAERIVKMEERLKAISITKDRDAAKEVERMAEELSRRHIHS